MTSSATIVHLISGLSSGGAEMMLYKLLSGLDRRRFRSVVVSLTPGGALAPRIEALGLPVHSLGMRRGQPTPRALWTLVQLLRRERPALLQTWLYHADLLGTLAAPLARVPRLAWNIRASDMDLTRYRRLSRLTRAACARLSARPQVVIVNSEAGRRYHQQLGYHPRAWAFIPNGINLDEFAPDPGHRRAVRAELGLPPDAPLIGLIARRDPMKDHATFFQAAARVARDRPGVHFLLAGHGVTPDDPLLARLLAATGLAGHAHLLGERRDVPRLTAALDLATLSSAYGEGFPNVLGEAMACAVPCVATAVGDSARIVGDTGAVVPPRDPAALARAWSALLTLPPADRAALGERARRRIADRYALPTIIRHYEHFYDRLLDPSSDPTTAPIAQ
jgi:glycosyltransferase involved in cell wall biosynthesis